MLPRHVRLEGIPTGVVLAAEGAVIACSHYVLRFYMLRHVTLGPGAVATLGALPHPLLGLPQPLTDHPLEI